MKNFNKRKEKFLPLFFLIQILDEVSLEKFKFSKLKFKTKLLRKWQFILEKKNIYELNESERFQLHQELEDILTIFYFLFASKFTFRLANRWRDKDDKLFHPSNLINGDVIKKHLKIKDGLS